MSLFVQNLDEHNALFARLAELDQVVTAAATVLTDTLRRGNKIIFCGNGGSAADSQHLAAEFTGRFIKDRVPLAAMSLTVDSSALTCIGNDYGFEFVFLRQIQALGRPGDCLVAISTSGQSGNVILAVDHAVRHDMATVGLLGRGGGALAGKCGVSIVVPSDITARIQEAHILIGHTLCGAVEQGLGLV